MQTGKIVQVMGPVVDVAFDTTPLPEIKTALKVDNHGRECVMEVAQQMGQSVVRCIMLSASEGLERDMVVTNTGAGITVPVVFRTTSSSATWILSVTGVTRRTTSSACG